MMRFTRCSTPKKRVTSPDPGGGASAHHRALESLQGSAPINRAFPSELEIVAERRRISGRKRVFVSAARLVDQYGDDAARGTGTFIRPQIALSSLAGYSQA